MQGHVLSTGGDVLSTYRENVLEYASFLQTGQQTNSLNSMELLTPTLLIIIAHKFASTMQKIMAGESCH